VVLNSLPKAGDTDIAQMIQERALRGRDLYLRSRQLITKTDTDEYRIPSSDGTTHYTVHYGAGREDCPCVDHLVHPSVACKHIQATAMLYASRRQPRVKMISVAGDPFALAGDHRLHELEERLAHELMDHEERQELRDRILMLRQRQED
jgi:hypothetical protein